MFLVLSLAQLRDTAESCRCKEAHIVVHADLSPCKEGVELQRARVINNSRIEGTEKTEYVVWRN